MNSPRRVKVYTLDNDGNWADCGTGHVEMPVLNTRHYLKVVSEENPDSLLLNKMVLSSDSVPFARQQDTLIVWTEPTGEDLALSFQEPEGCTDCWKALMAAQQLLKGSSTDLMDTNNDSDDMLDDALPPGIGKASLPDPSIGNLPAIRDTAVALCRTLHGREELGAFVVKNDYIAKLAEIFNQLEDLEAESDLRILYEIMKSIVSSGEAEMFCQLTEDDLILHVVGMLEYDPTVTGLPGTFRRFLENQAQYLRVIDLKQPEFDKTVQQAYRLGYLREVVLARFLDDYCFAKLNETLRILHMSIVRTLTSTPQFVKELVSIYQSTDAVRRQHAARLLKELVSIAKMSDLRMADVYHSLIQMGIFRIFSPALNDDDLSTRQAISEFLCTMTEVDPKSVQSYCSYVYRDCPDEEPLLDVLVDRMLVEPSIGLLQQVMEIIRILLEPEQVPIAGGRMSEAGPTLQTAVHITPEFEEFIGYFYERAANKLMRPVTIISHAHTGEQKVLTNGKVQRMPVLVFEHHQAEQIYFILELICLMVRCHHARAKQFLIHSGLPKSISLLMRSQEKHLQLAVLRFFRVVVSQKDEFYNRYIAQHNLLEPVVEALIRTENRYTLINSACIQLFEFIKSENIKTLVMYCAPRFQQHFEPITYVSTFRDLLLRYQQHIDRSMSEEDDGSEHDNVTESSSSQPSGAPGAQWGSAREREEEDYFSRDDDGDDNDDGSTPAPTESKNGDTDSSGHSPASAPAAADSTSTPERAEADQAIEGDAADARTSPAPAPDQPPQSEIKLLPLKSGLVNYSDDDDDEEWDRLSALASRGGNGEKTKQPPTASGSGGGVAKKAGGINFQLKSRPIVLGATVTRQADETRKKQRLV
ncbi:Platinum sensitivity protein [Sorochytrium milnesiophthora]